MNKPDPQNPPLTQPYWKFCCEKWDHEYARNVLLHFIEEKSLSDELIEWLDKRFPKEKYE